MTYEYAGSLTMLGLLLLYACTTSPDPRPERPLPIGSLVDTAHTGSPELTADPATNRYWMEVELDGTTWNELAGLPTIGTMAYPTPDAIITDTTITLTWPSGRTATYSR